MSVILPRFRMLLDANVAAREDLAAAMRLAAGEFPPRREAARHEGHPARAYGRLLDGRRVPATGGMTDVRC